MATGYLGGADLAAAATTKVYGVPTGKVSVFTVSVCNRNTSSVTFRLGICTATNAFATTEYIEYDTVLPANCAYERTGLVADASKNLLAYASTTGVTVNAWGYEESA